MARYVPVRPRWNPRGTVVNYVSGGQLCVRSWPKGYRDANTAAQRRQRGKMVQVCGVLPFLKAIFAVGYAPLIKRNGRRVGSYHMAVARALREWFDKTPRGEELNVAKIELTDGIRALPEGLSVARVGDEVRVAWVDAKWRRGARLLFAARARGSGQWVGTPVPLEKGAAGVLLQLPAGWKREAAEVWLAFVDGDGRAKSRTRYMQLAAPVTAGAGHSGAESPMLLPQATKGHKSPARRTPPVPPPGCRGACRFGLRGWYCVVKRE